MRKLLSFISPVGLFLLLAVLALLGTTACQKTDDAPSSSPPTVSSIRAYLASPNDSLLKKVGPGMAVAILGTNLKTTKQVFFDGYPATFNSALFADNSIVVNIPADIPFASLSPDDYNKVRVVTAGGETTVDFPVSAPAPVLAAVSNERARPGDVITISGNFLYLIRRITFPGNVNATTFTANTGGTEVTVTMPQSTLAGPVTLQTEFGTTTSTFLMNDNTGMLLNFDGIGTYVRGSTITNSTSLFPGGTGNYARLLNTNISAGNWSYDDGTRAIYSTARDWVTPAQLPLPAANFAMKFELFVREPFSTGVLFIGPPDNSTWVYMARYEPWKTNPNFTTSGWTTVTIPFTQFKRKSAAGKDGDGTPAVTMNDVLGSVNEIVRFMYVNDSTVPLAKLDIAIDNIRVVQIR